MFLLVANQTLRQHMAPSFCLFHNNLCPSDALTPMCCWKGPVLCRNLNYIKYKDHCLEEHFFFFELRQCWFCITNCEVLYYFNTCMNTMSCGTTKRTQWLVRQAKTQVQPVFAKCSIGRQPRRMRRLIWVFAWQKGILVGFLFAPAWFIWF